MLGSLILFTVTIFLSRNWNCCHELPHEAKSRGHWERVTSAIIGRLHVCVLTGEHCSMPLSVCVCVCVSRSRNGQCVWGFRLSGSCLLWARRKERASVLQPLLRWIKYDEHAAVFHCCSDATWTTSLKQRKKDWVCLRLCVWDTEREISEITEPVDSEVVDYFL